MSTPYTEREMNRDLEEMNAMRTLFVAAVAVAVVEAQTLR